MSAYGPHGYSYGPVDFIGGLARDICDATEFLSAMRSINSRQGLLMSPCLVDLADFGFAGFTAHVYIDSGRLGDVMADRWYGYAFGQFDMAKFLSYRVLRQPITIGDKYRRHGWALSAPKSDPYKYPHT